MSDDFSAKELGKKVLARAHLSQGWTPKDSVEDITQAFATIAAAYNVTKPPHILATLEYALSLEVQLTFQDALVDKVTLKATLDATKETYLQDVIALFKSLYAPLLNPLQALSKVTTLRYKPSEDNLHNYLDHAQATFIAAMKAVLESASARQRSQRTPRASVS